MASASAKSFLIADLLVNGESKVAEKSGNGPDNSFAPFEKNCKTKRDDDWRVNEKMTSAPSCSSRDSTPTRGNMDTHRRKESLTPESSPLSGDNKTVRSTRYDERSLTGIMPGGGYHPYLGFPMLFPTIPINAASANRLTEMESGARNYPNLSPYNIEYFRQNRHLAGRHHNGSLNPLMVPSITGIPHGSHLPGMDYPTYANFHGLYGLPMPSGVPGMHDKGAFAGDRDNYSLYHLSRSAYNVNCKRKGGQIRFTNTQTAQLEKAFIQQKYLNANDRKKLAHSLGLSDRQVKTWFQNRRAKLRKCKGGLCTESEVSGSPQDSRTVSPQGENMHYDNHGRGAESIGHFSGSD